MGGQLPQPLHGKDCPASPLACPGFLSHTGRGPGPYLPSRPPCRLHNLFTLRSACQPGPALLPRPLASASCKTRCGRAVHLFGERALEEKLSCFKIINPKLQSNQERLGPYRFSFLWGVSNLPADDTGTGGCCCVSEKSGHRHRAGPTGSPKSSGPASLNICAEAGRLCPHPGSGWGPGIAEPGRASYSVHLPTGPIPEPPWTAVNTCF